MVRVIVITGTPGSGKTTLARALSRKIRGSTLVSINRIVREKRLFSSYAGDGARIVRMRALKREIERRIRKSRGPVIVEGHLICEIRIRGAVAIVVREHLETIKSRLIERRYPIEKTRANVVSEAIGHCAATARKNYGKAYEVMSGKTAVAKALRIINGKDGKPVEIDLLAELPPMIKKDKRFAIG